MKLAPILLFTYKRFESLKDTVQALQQNSLAAESDLYIFSDGCKKNEDLEQVTKVREFIKTITGFKKITITEQEKNKGLANSIIDGVTSVMKFSDKVIVLEDDLYTTPNFLNFMNDALDFYASKPKVFSVSAYSFDLGESKADTDDAYFVNRGWSWGWGTWKDRWDDVDWQVKDYENFKNDKRRRKEFAKGGTDLNIMLHRQVSGLIDSWAIRWFYHQYKVGGLTLYPVHSKVRNNGFDEYATHTTGAAYRFAPSLDAEQLTKFKFPEVVAINPYYQSKFQKKMGVLERIKYRLNNIFRKIFK
ncbi:sugar transferase [Mucilaginibacter sp.]|jgi:hypothetical protein|uniref:sugar transferase n=1 Tax=Mucilaginibacter sp. TaxID=1882438 RepID=UPI002B744472|nr:sugar transferase [Mucilaginibacter sp.]HTI61598.1 hypothetical protein [Mucilaginibacter sp.]